VHASDSICSGPDLGHDFATSTCDIGFFTRSPGLSTNSPYPEHIHVFGLSDKVRLMRQYNRGQPIGIRKGDQSTLPGTLR